MDSTEVQHFDLAETIQISPGLYYRMRSHVIACLPEEACGLLAAAPTGIVRRHFPVENILHNQNRFQLKPEGQLKAFLWMEKYEITQVIIYHSHPTGPDHLSVSDIAESYYPDAIYLLWFRDQNKWRLRGFKILNSTQYQIKIEMK
jgi:[CysO sulfur-carrier protein]-S-L-cysteine hydrolase